MSLKAVVFDLFGTLIDNWPFERLEATHSRLAELLQVPVEEFTRLWRETWDERNRGKIATCEDNLRLICHALNSSPSRERISQACRFRLQVTRESFAPRPDAAATLTALRERGLKLGMISDCSWETPVVWEGSALAPLFDVAVFSVKEGVKKPDPRIYLLTCERLGVQPQECLYVGDGGSRELTGAAAVGMRPVLIRTPYEEGDAVHRVDGEDWDGERVSALAEVPGLVEGG